MQSGGAFELAGCASLWTACTRIPGFSGAQLDVVCLVSLVKVSYDFTPSAELSLQSLVDAIGDLIQVHVAR